MPTVPGYTGAPTVEPDVGAKAGYLKDNATPEAFGVGVDQARQGFFRQVGQTADTAADQVNRLQDQYNQAAITDMENQFTKLTAQKTAEYNQLRGKAAVDATPDYQQFLEDTRKTVLGGATNSAVARLADPHLTRVSTALSTDAIRHQVAQTYQYNQDETKSRITLSQDAAGQNSDDLVKFNDNLAKVEGDTIRLKVSQGYKPDDADTQLAVKQELTKAWQNRWTSMTMQGKSDAAMQEYEARRGNILDPDDHIHDAIYTGQTAQWLRTTTRGLATGELPSTKDRENYAMSVLQDRVGKIGAAGLVGGFHRESSGLDPTRINAGDGSDGSDSIGVGQWNAERADALKKFAKEKGTDWQDYKTQVAFVDKELQDRPDIADTLRNAKTPQEAAEIANRMYEVSADKPGDAGFAVREKHAVRLAGAEVASPNPMSPTRITDLVQTARSLAEQRFPDDPKIADQAEQSVRAYFNLQKQDIVNATQEARFNLKDGIYGPTDADSSARPPRFEELMSNPTWKANWDALGKLPNGAEEQKKLLGAINKNILSVPDSPDRTERFQTLKGIAADDPQRFRTTDFTGEDLTRQQLSELHQDQRKMNATAQANPDLAHARNLLKTTGFFTQINMHPSTAASPSPEYDKFIGQMNAQLSSMQARGIKPTDKDIRDTAAMLATPVPKSGIMTDNRFYQMSIPETDRRAIVEKFQARWPGQRPSEDRVRQIYNDAIFRAARKNPDIPVTP